VSYRGTHRRHRHPWPYEQVLVARAVL